LRQSEFASPECGGQIRGRAGVTDDPIRISVVIPAYNAAHFLPRSLASVFAQTLQPIEVIVVDDGSTDDTAAVAAQLGATVIRQPNGGISVARNTGIDHSSGEWVALLDVDDKWAPEKLERQWARIRSDTVLVYTGVRTFDDNGMREGQPAMDPLAAKKMLRFANPIAPSSVLMNRKAFDRAGPFRDIPSCEDWGMWVRLSRLGPFEVEPDVLTYYYVHPKSVSANPARMIAGLKKIIDKVLLSDLHGFDRWLWRRRILATQLCSAGLIARDNGLNGDLRYMFQSLCAWPSPLWQPRRFAIFAVSLRDHLLRR
jgi:glycosyltransferase involved in cell wall biosynthesis